jgi:hypothetical protein
VAKTIIVTVPHALRKAEAERRILKGLERVRATLPSVVKFEEIKSDPDRITLSARALAQSMTAAIIVQDKQVILEASVPMLLAPFTETATSAAEKWMARLLARRAV